MSKIRHDLTGAVRVGSHVLTAGDEVPAGAKVHAWVLEGAEPEDEAPTFAYDGTLDPGEFNAATVLDYLRSGVDITEVERVAEAERAGKNRKTLLATIDDDLSKGGDDGD